MKDLSQKLKDIFFRYALMVLVAIPNLWIFYAIFTPLTIYPSYWILDLFFNAKLLYGIKTIFLFGDIPSVFQMIEFIDACIAGSAYYLLLILNLSTPGIKVKKRVKMILVSFAVLLIVNLIRILILSILYVNGSSYFDVTHNLFWIFGNFLFVAIIWFAEVKYFKIEKIPFYSDLKFFFRLRKESHNSKRSKKNSSTRNKNSKSHR